MNERLFVSCGSRVPKWTGMILCTSDESITQWKERNECVQSARWGRWLSNQSVNVEWEKSDRVRSPREWCVAEEVIYNNCVMQDFCFTVNTEVLSALMDREECIAWAQSVYQLMAIASGNDLYSRWRYETMPTFKIRSNCLKYGREKK